MAQEPTPFELRVEISGVCLYVRDTDAKIGLLMPDARHQEGGTQHPDGEKAVPHVGYVRFDLANLAFGAGPSLIGEHARTPAYEVVHLFDREELHFELSEPTDEIDARQLALPDFDIFAPVKALRPGLFGDEPPPELLMRSVLRGGTLISRTEPGQWEISGELHPDGETQVGIFGGETWWVRTVHAPGMMIQVRSFETGLVTEIALRPTAAPGDGPAITLKIANLCANNPLEWETLEPYVVQGPDVDFKWLYRLLQLREGEDPKKYPSHVLPHPRPTGLRATNLLQDCFGGVISHAF